MGLGFGFGRPSCNKHNVEAAAAARASVRMSVHYSVIVLVPSENTQNQKHVCRTKFRFPVTHFFSRSLHSLVAGFFASRSAPRSALPLATSLAICRRNVYKKVYLIVGEMRSLDARLPPSSAARSPLSSAASQNSMVDRLRSASVVAFNSGIITIGQ